MVKKIVLLFCLAVLVTSCKSQSEMIIGEAAPKIKISKWLNSSPELEGKAVVIDFWFTNCAPCVASIPHLNELVEKYEGEAINFLAVTDDSRKKVEDFMERRKIDFKSFVGFDPLGRLEKKFGVVAYPQSYVIDSKGILKWAGSPLLLSTDIIDQVLGTTKSVLDNQIAEVTTATESLMIRRAGDGYGGSKLDRPSKTHRRSVFMANTLPKFISALSPYDTTRIEASGEINSIKYDITHEDFNYDDNPDAYNQKLIKDVLEALKVTSASAPAEVEGYTLEIVDESKLNKYKATRGALMINNTHVEGAIDLFNLSREMEKGLGEFIQSNSNDVQKYKVDLNVGNLNQLQQELNSKYGLTLKRQTITIQKLTLFKVY